MSHSYRDAAGGHRIGYVTGRDGDVYNTPGSHRFLKRLTHREDRRGARKEIEAGLREVEEEVHDQLELDQQEAEYEEYMMWLDNEEMQKQEAEEVWDDGGWFPENEWDDLYY